MSRFAAFAAALSLLVLGGLSGALGVHLFHAHHPPSAEPPPLLRGHVVQRLERHLQLTPEQSRELAAILRRAHHDGEELRAEVEPRLRHILVGAVDEIDEMLTPEQRRRFRKLRQRWDDAGMGRHGERALPDGWRQRRRNRPGGPRPDLRPRDRRHPEREAEPGEPAPSEEPVAGDNDL